MQHPLRRFKAELFKTLGHPLRIRMLELLEQIRRDEENKPT